MRYLGNKRNLLNFIDDVLMMHDAVPCADRILCVCDPFTGTTSVARHLKQQGWRVASGDTMACSYALQHAYIGLNEAPPFSGLLDAGALDDDFKLPVPLYRVIAHLNNLRSNLRSDTRNDYGFFYSHYAPDGPAGRRYFTAANALRIDSIRETIEAWRHLGWLTEQERYLLLASLIEAVSGVANIAGTYAAYLKGWDPRAHKPLVLAVPQIAYSGHEHSVNMADASEFVPQQECDLLYLDPPYNTRQYCTNYHILETIALGDEPEVKGVTGLRATNGNSSAFCRTGQAADALDKLVRETRAKWILMSYSSEGIIPPCRVVDILSQRGNVEIYACEYRRFRSDADSDSRKYKANGTLQEMLYWVEL